ncbi:hypothetical protein [Conexibacter sp. SYSU D00693]|uniref:hypothetical protein n=1 Tax=Conexibacter sp. SYSU D00693 TaxID=2812560 RepID=UPI00196B7084|nr:hypothetical protein [Conexibacter sp. SYSU D00693]
MSEEDDFFAPPPPPPPAEVACEAPPWAGAARGVLGSVVPLDLVLARTSRVAVVVSHLRVFPNGCTIPVEVQTAPGVELPDEGPFWGRRDLEPEVLRFGVELADGSRATTVDRSRMWDDDPPTGPVLSPGGGDGGGGTWRLRLWLWPLPPPGRFELVCAWPSEGIALTRAAVDTQLVHAAAQRAVALFAGG